MRAGTVKYHRRMLLETPLPPEVTARSRLIQGMAQALASKGYGELTIADIVAEAAVSRRTFYEHFDSKDACFLALYEAANQQCLRVLAAAVDPSRPWREQTRGALKAYLSTMDASPPLTRTLLMEVFHLGLPGLAARRRAHGAIAALMQQIINARAEPGRHLSIALAVAVIGGVHELVLERIESGAPISGLVEEASELVLRVAA